MCFKSEQIWQSVNETPDLSKWEATEDVDKKTDSDCASLGHLLLLQTDTECSRQKLWGPRSFLKQLKGRKFLPSNTAQTLVDAEPSATGVEDESQLRLCEEGHTHWPLSGMPANFPIDSERPLKQWKNPSKWHCFSSPLAHTQTAEFTCWLHCERYEWFICQAGPHNSAASWTFLQLVNNDMLL